MAGSKALYRKITTDTGIVFINDIKQGIIFKLNNGKYLFVESKTSTTFDDRSKVHEYFGGLKNFDETINSDFDQPS